jgi:ABC-type transporter Mla subunit MlaD
MADETKKIILQLQIDQSKSLGEIVNLKDRISKLKEEQKALNLETEEGRKTFEAYNAQIKALTKEQKSLELAVEKTAAGFEFEAGSIAANRAELSKLTAEYKNLANPTAAQTKRIKDLSDRLKEQEAAIGNTSRNVGNYKDALVGIQSQLGVFGPQVQQLTVGFKGVTEGLKIASSGFTTLKGAIATTGIGILLLALASLISLFKNTDDGATKLEGAMGALGAITKEVTGFFAEIGDTLISIADGSESLEETLTGLGDFLINNLVNRLTSVLVAGDAVAKFFQGDWKGAAKTGLDAVIQFNTGIEGGTDKVTAYAKELAIVAEQAYQFAIQLDEVNDAQ